MSKLGYIGGVIKKASLEKLNSVVDEIQEQTGMGRAKIIKEIAHCSRKFGSGYYDYNIFEFFNLTDEQRDTYMTRLRSREFITFMNDPEYSHCFDDKTEFNDIFKDYIGREFLDLDSTSDEELRRFYETKEKVFAKPKNASCGEGCEKLQTGDFESFEAFKSYLEEKGMGTLEDVIENHPEINAIYPFAVNTMRMITLLDSKGEVHLIFAVLKMGINGRVVDNLGLYGPLDLETGEFLYPAHAGDTRIRINYTEHPYSHVPLVGFKVPYFKEAKEMVFRAAKVIPQVRYVGWDVAVTPNGPVIIEGNNWCAHDFWQLPGHTPDGVGIMPTIKKLIPEFSFRHDPNNRYYR